MKIAYLTTQFLEVISGPGRFTEYLKTLHFDNLELHFFSHQIEIDTKLLHPVNQPKWTLKIPFTSWFRAWYFAKSVEAANQKMNFDFILAADYSMAMFLPQTILNKTFVMVNDPKLLNVFSKTEAETGISVRKRWSRMMGYYLEKWVVRNAHIAVSNSQYTSRLIEEKYRLSKERIRLLYKAVDLSFFKFELPEVKHPRRFLFIKNDWYIGGLDYILEALGQLPYQNKIHFTIVGIADPDKPEIENLIQKSGFMGTFEILGLRKKAEVLTLFRQADLFINLSRKEALGVSCLEAMASGLPVIASDAGGLKEVLDFGKAGFMVPKENVEHLAATLIEIDCHPELMQAKALHAKEHVKKFSLEALYQNFETLFRS